MNQLREQSPEFRWSTTLRHPAAATFLFRQGLLNCLLASLGQILWRFTGMVLLLGTLPGHAGTVDLSKPIEVSPDRGVVLFSYTWSNLREKYSSLLWRRKGSESVINEEGASGDLAIKTGGLFKNEELFNTAHHRPGALFGLELAPGTYEFYQIRTNGKGNTATAERAFSRQFVVEAGKISYIGNLDILTGEGSFGVGQVFAYLLIGFSTNTVSVYPTLVDRAEIDLPLIAAKGNGLDPAKVVRNVIVDDVDRNMFERLAQLRKQAESGDLVAQHILLEGLASGWVALPDQTRVKIFTGQEAWKNYATRLAEQGVPGAASYLGASFDTVITKPGRYFWFFEKDDPAAALRNYLIDAARYQDGAIGRAMRLLAEDNRADTGKQAAHLKNRQEGLRLLTPESIPYGDRTTRDAFEKFQALFSPKYFALSPSGAHGTSGGDFPTVKAALDACNAINPDPQAPCRIYAGYVSKQWNACPPELSTDKAMLAPPVTGLGDTADAGKLPAALTKAGREAHERFQKLVFPRAFAINETGAHGLAAGDCQAAYRALQECRQTGQGPCRLWAVDDQIVEGATDGDWLAEEQRLLSVVAAEAGKNERREKLTKGEAQ